MGSTTRDSDPTGLVQGLTFCISNKLPGHTNDRWPTLCSWWADKYSNGACVRWLVSNFYSTAIFEEILVTVYTRTHRKKINEL